MQTRGHAPLRFAPSDQGIEWLRTECIRQMEEVGLGQNRRVLDGIQLAGRDSRGVRPSVRPFVCPTDLPANEPREDGMER